MDEKFLEKTVEVWQPSSPVRLTPADGGEIIRNMTGLMMVLMKIHERGAMQWTMQQRNG